MQQSRHISQFNIFCPHNQLSRMVNNRQKMKATSRKTSRTAAAIPAQSDSGSQQKQPELPAVEAVPNRPRRNLRPTQKGAALAENLASSAEDSEGDEMEIEDAIDNLIGESDLRDDVGHLQGAALDTKSRAEKSRNLNPKKTGKEDSDYEVRSGHQEGSDAGVSDSESSSGDEVEGELFGKSYMACRQILIRNEPKRGGSYSSLHLLVRWGFGYIFCQIIHYLV